MRECFFSSFQSRLPPGIGRYNARMTVHVLFFASLAQTLGQDRCELSLPAGTTVGDALDQLRNRFAALNEVMDRLAFAVDLEYVSREHVLTDGAELALIPPVSGG